MRLCAVAKSFDGVALDYLDLGDKTSVGVALALVRNEITE
jgi:hypothetical protein